MIKKKPFHQQKNYQEKLKENEKLKNWFFEEFWLKNKRISEVSGDVVGYTFSTAYYHHILNKKEYPLFKYKKENIIVLTLQEHYTVERLPHFYEEINKRKEKLLEEYGNL